MPYSHKQTAPKEIRALERADDEVSGWTKQGKTTWELEGGCMDVTKSAEKVSEKFNGSSVHSTTNLEWTPRWQQHQGTAGGSKGPDVIGLSGLHLYHPADLHVYSKQQNCRDMNQTTCSTKACPPGSWQINKLAKEINEQINLQRESHTAEGRLNGKNSIWDWEISWWMNCTFHSSSASNSYFKGRLCPISQVRTLENQQEGRR